MMKHQIKQILSTLLVIAMITGSLCGVITSAENISNYIESVADGEADEELLHNHAEAATTCTLKLTGGTECSCNYGKDILQ